jgi:hypothetical protein
MPISVNKRAREKQRQEKQKDKEVKRKQLKIEKDARGPADPDAGDPDIAGIIPGPQPIPEDW